MIGVADIFRDAVDVVDLGNPLAKRFEHLAIVDFLKGFAIKHVTPDLTDQKDHRGAVLMGDMHARRRIGCTWTARDHADAGFSGQFAVRLGHNGGTAFLAADDWFYIGMVDQAIENSQIALTGNKINPFAAMKGKLIDQYASAVTHFRSIRHSGLPEMRIVLVGRFCA